MSVPVTFTFSNIANGYCWPGAQQFWSDIQLLIAATVDSGVGFNFGSTTPGVDDRDKPWVRTETDGSLIGVYTFGNGLWVRPHPVSPSSDYRSLWVGTLANLKTFEGGADEAITETTGPFWEEDTNFQAKCLMGPGSFTEYNGTTRDALGVGETTGSEKVRLAETEMPVHNHTFAIHQGDGTNNGNYIMACDESTIQQADHPTNAAGGSAGVTRYHENLPPVRGIYVIKRTARKYYTVAG